MGYYTTVDTKYHGTSLEQVSVHLGMLVFVGVILKLNKALIAYNYLYVCFQLTVTVYWVDSTYMH